MDTPDTPTFSDRYLTVLLEGAAQTAYAVTRAYSQQLGDSSFKPWFEAEEWQRQTIRKGVENCFKNGSSAEQAHESWLKEKQATGWVYGPVKDALLKQHPCIVPYDQLPIFQKMKDDLFLAAVRGFLDKHGVRFPQP